MPTEIHDHSKQHPKHSINN